MQDDNDGKELTVGLHEFLSNVCNHSLNDFCKQEVKGIQEIINIDYNIDLG